MFVMSVAERRGGAEQMLWLLLREHDPQRIRPSVVFLEPGSFVDETRALGIPADVIPAGRLRDLGRGTRTIGRLARRMNRTKPDVILSWMGKSHLYAGPAAALAGRSASAAWWLHDIPSFTWSDRLTQAVPAAAVGSSSAIGATVLGDLRPRRPTFVVRPGVEDFMDDGTDELRIATRDNLGIGTKEVVVALIGRFHPQKGQDRLVEALATLRADRVPVRGLLVGGAAHGQETDYESAVLRQITQRGLSDVITHVDHVDAPWGYLLAADVYVNARVRENLSLGILEAACAGRAIVAVAGGGTPEILEHGVSALLVDQPDPSSLANAVRVLVDDPERRSQLGAQARKRYERQFTVSRMVGELQDSITNLCATGHPNIGQAN